jgi:hypothetical protein
VRAPTGCHSLPLLEIRHWIGHIGGIGAHEGRRQWGQRSRGFAFSI